jgi:hypothetical protein
MLLTALKYRSDSVGIQGDDDSQGCDQFLI